MRDETKFSSVVNAGLFYEDFAHSRSHVAHGYRFHEECSYPQEFCPVLIEFLAESRAQDYGDIGADLQDFSCQIGARHVGHRQIGDNQVKAFVPRSENLERIGAAIPWDDFITQGLEHLLDHFDDGLLVIDHQDQSMPFDQRRRYIGRRLANGCGPREIDIKSGPLAWFARYGDCPGQVS